MRFTDTRLAQLQDDWSALAEPRDRAAGHNLLIDERLHGGRFAAFESFVNGAADVEALRRAAIDYYRERVRVPAPETFTALNLPAALGPLATEQKVVRLEKLTEILDKTHIDFELLMKAFEAKDTISRALVDSFIKQWNERPDIPKNPVSFAAVKDQILEEIAADDWPERLRDRLGLAHLDPIEAPIPVALMEYEISAVIAGTTGTPQFCCPTALDCEPYYQFVPTPAELPFGCPMALYCVYSDEELIAEFLHPRLTYSRGNLRKLGYVSARPGVCDFVELRNNHIGALRLATFRDDFGIEL